MRQSLVLDRLRDGEAVWCAATALTDPAVIEVMGLLGVHCVWIDMEHGPAGLETVRAQVLAAKAHGMDAMVRVPKGCYSDWIRPLECDASGIMIPHVMSGVEAAEIVQTTKFHPVGRRPLNGGNADGPYCLRPAADYCAWANKHRFVVVQIEDKEAVDDMEAIVAADGVDLVFLGPADLAHSYGVPGQTDHPKVRGALEKMAALCRLYGRFWGAPCPPDRAREMLDMGAQFLAYGSDVILLSRALRDYRAQYAAAGLHFDSAY